MHSSKTTLLNHQHSRRAAGRGGSAATAAAGRTKRRLAVGVSSSATSPSARGSCSEEDPAPAATTRRSALLLGAWATTLLAPAARAEEVETATTTAPADASTSGRPVPASSSSSSNAQRIYLDVRIDGEPAGRLEIELLPSAAPVGSQRFADLAEEKGGVGYRLAKWDGIFLEKNYLRNAGAKSLSYSADGVSQVAGGDSTLALEREMDNPARPLHDRAGLVSLVVREAEARPTKERLVAMGGKLVTVSSQAGEAPNGSAFCVTLGPAPDLDKTNLVVGRLVPGPGTDAAIAALSSLPVNRPREGIQKPFFEAGKRIGDSRAIVAEKGFYRPLKRAIISGGGPVV